MNKPQSFQVEACWDSKFEGIDCLETKTQFGFFKSINDTRPSQCTWIDKEDKKTLETFTNELKKN